MDTPLPSPHSGEIVGTPNGVSERPTIMKQFRQRKSPRLPGYDYSQSGAYFVTICTHQRQHLFGQIDNDEMILNSTGEIAANCWSAIPEHYPDVELDLFVVMPNHIHGTLYIDGENSKFRTILGRVINAYKGAVTARIRKLTSPDGVIWQNRYHDHIIRNEKGLRKIQEYVLHNPTLWAEDTFYSDG